MLCLDWKRERESLRGMCRTSSLSCAVVCLSQQNFIYISNALTYLYLWRRRSSGADWVGITYWVDHVSDGGAPGSTVLCELTRDFYPVLSQSCLAEDSRSGERSHVFLECRGCPRLLAGVGTYLMIRQDMVGRNNEIGTCVVEPELGVKTKGSLCDF